MRNQEIPGCPLSHKKLRKYVHTRFIIKCHIVTRSSVEVAEKPMVDRSDIPKYSCAGVHNSVGDLSCIENEVIPYIVILFLLVIIETDQ